MLSCCRNTLKGSFQLDNATAAGMFTRINGYCFTLYRSFYFVRVPSNSLSISKSYPVNCQLVRVLHDILEDETFKFNSKPTREVGEAAVLLLDWATQEENLSVTTEFLKERFNKCLKHINPAALKQRKALEIILYSALIRGI